jgi:hypothetical protein
MRLAKAPRSGVEGQFLTRIGMFSKPDGSFPWICVFSLVKNGRGETVVFWAADQAQFFAHLATVTNMIHGITVNTTPTDSTSATAAAVDSAAARPEARESGDMIPQLVYDEPDGFYRGGGTSVVEYDSRAVNCQVQVYPFRPYRGDIRAQFRQTLMRDWIDPRFREEVQFVTQPRWSTNRMNGADAVLVANFYENPVGIPRPRMRVVIVAGSYAAIVDAGAITESAWQAADKSINAMLASMRVGQKPAPPSLTGGPGPAGAAVAGLYSADRKKFMVNMAGPVGSGYFVDARYYYLFSADGRVFRGYNFPAGIDWRGFDFDTVQRDDPGNTGRYTVRGNELFFQMASPSSEMMTGAISPNSLEIETIKYQRATSGQ